MDLNLHIKNEKNINYDQPNVLLPNMLFIRIKKETQIENSLVQIIITLNECFRGNYPQKGNSCNWCGIMLKYMICLGGAVACLKP